MRTIFIDELVKKTRSDPSIFLLTGDLGYSVVEAFQEEFPLRFINCGVAEQSMMSVAAGISSTGSQVFTYSISNFATFRCLEQIRNDIGYHNFPVCIVAVGAGTSYGTLGYSHHGLEDIAIMRSIPGLRIYSPGNREETIYALNDILATPGPAYLRLGRHTDYSVENLGGTIDAIYESHAGSDVSIVYSGTVGFQISRTIDLLADIGISAQAISLPQIEPIKYESLANLIQGKPVVTVEEHSTRGGLGSAIIEVLTKRNALGRILTLGYPPSSQMSVGNNEYMMRNAGLDEHSLVRSITDFLL